jgi:hypothetical protein
MACAGAACDGDDECEAEAAFAEGGRRCLEGTCTMPIRGIGSNAMCNSNVQVTFEVAGTSKGDDEALGVEMPIALAFGCGVLALFVRVMAIARGSRVSMRHALFVNPFQRQAGIQRQLTMRQQSVHRENKPAQGATLQPTAPSQMRVPGRDGQRDTIVVFQQSAPVVRAPATQSSYATNADQYYPDI